MMDRGEQAHGMATAEAMAGPRVPSNGRVKWEGPSVNRRADLAERGRSVRSRGKIPALITARKAVIC